MTNQMFIYTRKEPLPIQIEGGPTKFKEFKDSFNPLLVIRTITQNDDSVLVLLNDIHNRQLEVPVKNKQGKITAVRRETVTVQSEIFLEKEDAERFYQMVSI
jgi:hypothetical protein